jgi:hypothetical protein
VKKGYKALKMRGGRGHPERGDIESAKALRSAFGDEIDLLVDVNSEYGDYTTSKRMAREFERAPFFLRVWKKLSIGALSKQSALRACPSLSRPGLLQVGLILLDEDGGALTSRPTPFPLLLRQLYPSPDLQTRRPFERVGAISR